MNIVRFIDGDKAPQHGVLDGDNIYPLPDAPWFGMGLVGEPVPRQVVRLVAPLVPERIICVGLNYRSHAEEMGAALPDRPMFFSKLPSSVIGSEEAIIYPRQLETLYHGASLAIVIGTEGRHIPVEKALDHVFGYTAANNISQQNLQKSEIETGAVPITRDFETFCPLGPVIETDLDPAKLAITCRVNGQTRQLSTTADLIFPVAEIISLLSGPKTLIPGDVILTGTPAGAGRIEAGDMLEVEISNIGVLRNPVVAEEQAG
jgi:2-keto-4-pentenoate hydratase/2-oxohepta-3-ene-1,7-dioic acid hydratase in catechol pathway